MKNKTVTLADIARELNISSNAVSLALRGKDGVSESLRREVLKKAAEMNYIRTEKSLGNIIAIIPQRIAPMRSGSFYQQLCFHMESYARSLGYLLILCSLTEEEEDSLLLHPMLTNIPCVGIISIGNLSRDYCEMLQRLGMKYVMADQYYDDLMIDSVNTANTTAAFLLTQHLIEHGHRRIQFFGQARKTSSLADRWVGYKRAMRAAGLPILHNAFIDVQTRDGAHEFECVRSSIEQLTELPTAYVCGHDDTAMEVLDILRARGLRCPEDFSLVGFDNVLNPAVAPLHLTTYQTPRDEIAEAAIRMVLDNEMTCPHRIQLFGELIVRDSVKTLS